MNLHLNQKERKAIKLKLKILQHPITKRKINSKNLVTILSQREIQEAHRKRMIDAFII